MSATAATRYGPGSTGNAPRAEWEQLGLDDEATLQPAPHEIKPPARSPRNTLACLGFRPCRNGTLVGFAIIKFNELCLEVRDVAIHRKGNARWAQLPAKAQLDEDGQTIRLDGKVQYVNIFSFDAPVVREAFSAAAVAAVIRKYPRAFDLAEEVGP